MAGFFDGAGSGLLSGVGSFISNIIGGKRQDKIVQRQIDAQREENEKAREYNLNLAKLQNQWSIDQWNRENAYNTPANQMRLLREGGLNPDLMYGQGAGSSLSAASPEMTAGAPASPADVSAYSQLPNNARQAALDSVAIMNGLASAAETRAKARKAQGESDLIDIDKLTRAAQNGETLKLTSVNVEVQKGVVELNKAKKEQVVSSINEINAHVEEMRQSIAESKARTQTEYQKAADLFSQRFWRNQKGDKEIQLLDKQIDKLSSEIDINKEQLKTIMMLAVAKVKNLNADSLLKGAQAAVADRDFWLKDTLISLADARTTNFTLTNDLIERFGGYEKTAQIISLYGNTLSSVLDSVTGTITRGLSQALKGKKSSGNSWQPVNESPTQSVSKMDFPWMQ